METTLSVDRKLRTAQTLILSLVAVLICGGCASSGLDSASVAVKILTPAGISSDPYQGVDFIRMTVTGGDLSEPLVQTFSRGSQNGRIRGIPFGSGIQIEIEGLIGSPQGAVIARGKTRPLTVSKDDTSTAINLFFSRVNTFVPTSSVVNKSPSVYPSDRLGAAVIELRDGRVLIAGGGTISSVGRITKILDSALIFDPNTGDFTTLEQKMQLPRAFHSATLLDDGRVLLVGGSTLINTLEEGARPAEIFNPTDGSFSAAGTLLTGRNYHTATKMADGSVVIVGGLAPGANATYLKSVERFDPKTTTFSSLSDLSNERAHHTATLIPNSSVITLIGGSKTGNGLDTIEFLDASVGGTVQTGPTMPTARVFHSVNYLANHRILVIAGGYANENQREKPHADLIVLDLVTRQLVPIVGAKLNHARGHHLAAAINGSKILIVGGWLGDGNVTQAEIIEAKSQTQLSVVRLENTTPIAPRARGTALKLQNNTILIVGGISSATSMQGERRGEFFNPGQ